MALQQTDRTTLRRKADRGSYDRDLANAILDEGLVCHVGFAVDGRTTVIPTAYGRVEDSLYLHGAAGNHALRTLAGGADCCVTVTLLDGLVLAKSAFHHSMNYRSVVLFGRAEPVTDSDEKRVALAAIVDHMQRGRSAETRGPNDKELRATLVVRLPIDEGSVKVRSGGPVDEPEDLELPYWTGVVPVTAVRGAPIPA
jgi:uncharacterized protein